MLQQKQRMKKAAQTYRLQTTDYRLQTTDYRLLLLLLIFFSVVVIPTAFAQEKSGEVLKELERRELIPEKKAPALPLIEKQERPKPEHKEEKEETIFVKKINVQGTTLLSAEKIHSLIESYENKDLTLDDLSIAADLITNAYRKLGFLITYAFIPLQDIKDGIVTIKVIEGIVGEIEVTGNKHYSSGFIQKHLERTRKDPSLKEQTLERALLILNDYPMLKVRTSLRAGDKPGTADLLAAATDSRYISGGISYDDFGSKTISKHRTALWFDMGGLAADGDLLMLRGSTGLDRIDLNKLSYGRAEYLIPVDHNGTKLGFYGANSLYKVGENLTPLQIEGTATLLGFYLTHPIIKKRDQTLSVRAGFDYKNVTDYMLDSLNSKDNIRTATLALNYDFYDAFEGRNVIGFTYHQGLSGFLGGATINEVGTSRADADGGFNKYTMDYVRLQGITEFTHVLVKAAGQASGTTLFSAEQFSIGGMGTVRGFKSSAHSGDSGYIFSTELHTWPIFPETKIFDQRLGDTIKFVPFWDCGRVYRDNVQPGENKSSYIQSVGAGIRLYAGRKFSMRLDYAVPKVNGIFHKRNSMTYAQVTMAF